MKKQLLIISSLMLGLATFAVAQFTIATTSLSYTGNTVPTTGNGRFYSFQPGYPGGSTVSDCSGDMTGVGGFDPSIFASASGNGVVVYGGDIRRVYTGTPCVSNDPSFGFNTANTNLADGVNIDLSDVANQRLSFTYMSDADVTFYLQLFDQDYTAKLDQTIAVNFIGDNTEHRLVIDFSDDVIDGADLTNVRQVSFVYTSTTISPGFGIHLSSIDLGSTVTSAKNATASISKVSMYPNPVSDIVSLDVDLKSVSDVKVTLTDLMGKEVMKVAEKTSASLKETFSVAHLNKGMYVMNFIVDGVAAKSEMLMVK